MDWRRQEGECPPLCRSVVSRLCGSTSFAELSGKGAPHPAPLLRFGIDCRPPPSPSPIRRGPVKNPKIPRWARTLIRFMRRKIRNFCGFFIVLGLGFHTAEAGSKNLIELFY